MPEQKAAGFQKFAGELTAGGKPREFIDAAVSANVGSVDSQSVAVADQSAVIDQTITGNATATGDQTSTINQ